MFILKLLAVKVLLGVNKCAKQSTFPPRLRLTGKLCRGPRVRHGGRVISPKPS